MSTRNPYKTFSDNIESLAEHVRGEVLVDERLEAEQDVRDMGYASMKDYQESNE